MKRWEYTMACFDVSAKDAPLSGANLYSLNEKTGQPVINVNGVTPLAYMNFLGEQGWELVTQTYVARDGSAHPNQILFSFKRQKGV
jgi:hypothetical protein